MSIFSFTLSAYYLATSHIRGTLSAIPIFPCNIAKYMVDCMYDL
jgi:hypothetical protein